jgi:preprotein translocase subunit SecG
MNLLVNYLPWIQVVLAVLLTASILFQQSEGSLGSAFGGSSSFGSSFNTKRGLEKNLFIITVILAVIFVASALLRLFI